MKILDMEQHHCPGYQLKDCIYCEPFTGLCSNRSPHKVSEEIRENLHEGLAVSNTYLGCKCTGYVKGVLK